MGHFGFADVVNVKALEMHERRDGKDRHFKTDNFID